MKHFRPTFILFAITLVLIPCQSVLGSQTGFQSSASSPDWREIGVPYLAVDGLTVTLNKFTIDEKVGSYQYKISYTLKNENLDKKILEGSFKMYYKDASGGLPQYGFFNYLFPGDQITRSYAFEELKSKPFDVLEYHHDNFFSPEPLEDSLKWKVEIPDNTPPQILNVTQEPKPEEVKAFENVTVLVNATDDISGVKEVILSYIIDDGTEWTNLTAIYNSTSGLYETAIPGKPLDTVVKYKIIAYDNAGNYKVEDNNGQFYVYIILHKFSTTISCSVSRSYLTLGEYLTVSGFISPPVSNVNVTLTYTKPDLSISNRTVTSAADGSYSDTYKPDTVGSWSVKASWEGDLIHEGASSSPVSFHVRPYLEVHCVDGDHESLSSLTVKLHNSTGHLIQTGITNSTGWVKFTSLLPYNYTLKGYWYGVEVANYVVEVTSATVVDPLHCGVYDYYVNVIDGNGESVENANVKLYFANGTYFMSALTNSSGWADFVNLANTTYNIRTFYQGTQVSNLADTLSVQGQIRIVNAGIFNLIVHAVNEKGDDLPNVIATLSWLNGTKMGSKTSNSTGYVVFENLPSTTYSIKVSLEGYREKSVEITITSEDQIETMTLQSIPFIETPTGISIISGVTVASIIVIVMILKKRLRA